MPTPLRFALMRNLDQGRNTFLNLKKSVRALIFKDDYRARRKHNIPDWYWLPKRMTPGFEKKLNKFGLVYDDWVWEDRQCTGPDKTIRKALDRVPKEVLEMRQRRIDRANDLQFKHIGLPESMYNHQGKPFDPKMMYLTPIVSKMKMEERINRDMVYKYE
eukprot:115255_1